MKKNGFTLVELLAVIVLIALLLGAGVPGIMRISSRMKQKSLNTKVDLVEEAAIFWGQDNKSLLQSSKNCFEETDEDDVVRQYDCRKITIELLIEEDYIDGDNSQNTMKNPIDDSEMKCDCLFVYKKNKRVYAMYSDEKKLIDPVTNKCDETSECLVR